MRAGFDTMREESHQKYCQQEGKGLLFLMRIKAAPQIYSHFPTMNIKKLCERNSLKKSPCFFSFP